MSIRNGKPMNHYQEFQQRNGFAIASRENTASTQALQRPYTYPASSGTAPAGSLATGNGRTRSVTTPTENRLQDAVTMRLQPIGGGISQIVWTYTTVFDKAPAVSFAPIGAPPAGFISIHLAANSPGQNSVTINSTYSGADDLREVNIQALGRP